MSQVITDFRAKHPQYDGIADDQLVTALHGKYYSQMPIEEFNQKIGYQAPHPTQGIPSVDEQADMVAQPDDHETLSLTGNSTSEGRPIYENQHGDLVTERTITENVPELGGWVNLPTVYDGRFVSPDEAIQIAIEAKGSDPLTGRKFDVFNDVDSAVESAKSRSSVKLSNEMQGAQPDSGTGPSFIPNVAAGTAERAGDVAGGFLTAVNVAAEAGQEALPMGGFVWEGGVLPTYKNAEEYEAYKAQGGKELLKEAESGAKEFDAGYVPTHTWEAVKEEFSEGGPLSGSAWGEVVGYVGEQGIKSIPDMAAAVFNLPAYVVARSGEIGETRAQNKGKDKTELTDVLEAAPFALGSALLERVGAKGITEAGAEAFGKEALKQGFKEAAKRTAKAGAKAGGKEAATEAVQEGIIEYTGEKLGTDAKMIVAEAFDRGFAGAVAGGGMGTAAGTASAAYKEASYDPEAELGKALNAYIEGTEFTGIDKAAASALSPEMAQVEKVSKPSEQAVAPATETASPEISASLDISEKEQVEQIDKKIDRDQVKSEPKKESVLKGKIKGLQVVEAPVSEVKLSKDVPQFKEGAGKEGVVEPLGGTFERTGVAPIQIWVREDGTKEVISGRHRLDLAKRSGEETIPAQYHYESEGFNKAQAASLDAILNIREGQGKVKDYVEFIQANQFSEKEAAAEGILGRAVGKRAFTIATKGSPSLIASHSADQVTDEGATKIANAAPNNEALQAVGLKAIQDGKTITVAENLVKAVASMTTDTQQASADLFGFDDSAMKEAVELAKKASRKQAEIQRTLTAVTGAAKNPELAKKEGVDVKDPEGIKKKIKFLKSKKKAWDNWHTNPRLMAELKGKPGLELAQETEADIAKREKQQEEAKQAEAKEQKAKEDKAQADKDAKGFVLAGSELEADQAMAHGQDALFASKRPAINAKSFSEKIKKKNKTVSFQIREQGDIVYLDKIVVPEGSREKGVGTKAMNDVIGLADEKGKTISLTPSSDFGGNKKRLVEFYKGFGFVENKGKNRDYEISDSMYRLPKAQVPKKLSSKTPTAIPEPPKGNVMETKSNTRVFIKTPDNKIMMYSPNKAEWQDVTNKVAGANAIKMDEQIKEAGGKKQWLALQEQKEKDFEKRYEARKAERKAEKEKEDESYKMQHTAPTKEFNPSALDLNEVFPDIYTGNAMQYYGTGMAYDGKAINIIQSMKSAPKKKVTIYRAVPNSVTEINAGDWVTTTKEYAKDHMAGETGWHIITDKAFPGDLASDGNSIHEFGYDPEKPKVTPKADGTVTDYGTKSFKEFTEQLKSGKPTKADIQSNFDSLVKNKDSVLAELSTMTKAQLKPLVWSPSSRMTKQDLIDQAYKDMLAAHSVVRDQTTEFNGSEDYESQIAEAVKAQSQEDIDTGLAFENRETGDDTKNQTLETRRGEIKGEKVPEKLNSQRPASETGAIMHAPGHNYVQLYRSTGLPPRREIVSIDGRAIKMPSEPQRIEPIMRDLVSIMGRRIYNGKIKGKSTEGFYRQGVGELRTRRKNDVEILAHEMAHYLDMYSDEILPNFQDLYKQDQYKDEVAALSYTNEKKLELIEGFAEFVRLWLTNSQEAKTRAPDFYDAFNAKLAKDKKLNKQMRSLQNGMHKYYFQGADHLGRALIGQEDGMYGKFMDWTYRRDSLIRQQTIDKMHAAREAEKELTGQVGTVEESAWKQFRIANGGYEGIAEYIMNYGTLQFAENGDLVPSGKGLYEILKPVDTIDMGKKYKGEKPIDLLMRYFAGRRALELHRQDRENLIPKETAKTWAKMGKDFPVFESIFKEYQQFNDRMMNMFVDAGLLTADARATMAKVNQDYVPFNRLRDSLEEGKGGGGGFHKLKGGTANLQDILANIQDGITSNVKAALEARAKQRLYQYVAGHRDGAIWATKLAPDSKMVKTHLEDMQAKIEEVLEASGVVVEGELDLSDPGLLNFWQHGVKPTLTESGNFVDTVLVNGKPQYYEVQDPLLQEMLLGMSPDSYGSFMNIMFGVKNFFTRSITLGIEFTGANLVRDTIGATFISKNQFTPFLDSFKGMYSYMRKDKHFQDFMRSGGGYSSRLHGSTKAAKARQRIQIKEFGVGNKLQRILSKVDNIMSVFEYGTRIGEFRLAKKNLASDMDAAFAAREISTDFSVYGQNHFFTGYIRTIPFLNAMIQSQDRVFREAFVFKKYGGNPTALAMKAFLGLTVPTLLLWLVNKDDEDYKEIPDHEKRTNWHFPMGDGTFIKMPRPYDVGFVFATMPELFFKYMEDENGKEYAEGMAWTMLQMYGVDGVPAAAQGWWDVTRNKKWTGAPVVPDSMADVSASEQYNANTSETFIRLGQALGVSPMKAEHMFKAQTGYLGGYLLWGTEHMMWDEEKFGEKPERDISSNVFLRRFLTPKVRPNNRSMEKFFDLKEQSDRVTADFKAGIDIRRAIKGDIKGDLKRDSTFFGLEQEEKEVLFALNDSMNDLIKVIYGKKGMKTKELAIRYDKELTGEQKREELDSLWTQRNAAFTQYYGQAKKALDEAKALSKKNKIEDLRMQVLNHTKKGN